jgi:hypothetical protein
MRAERDGDTLYAEAKGRTSLVGLDIDTLYGQLLRRMPLDESNARFAVVVPVEARALQPQHDHGAGTAATSGIQDDPLPLR